MELFYTGVGAREVPTDVELYMFNLGRWFAENNIKLRSGHAKGSDDAFERGCNSVNGKKEIYLPWKGFEGSNSDLIVSDPKAYAIAKQHHKGWDNLKQGAKKLMARNSHQLLGQNLETPSTLVVCWTPKGETVGGTGQAIRIAEHYNIPIVNIGKFSSFSEASNEITRILQEVRSHV